MTRFLLGRTLVVSNDREFLEQGRRVLLRLGAGTVTVLPDSLDLIARLRSLHPFTLILHNPARETQRRASLPRLTSGADVIANLGRPNPEPPRLILISDDANPTELTELIGLGYQDVLIKPLNDAMLETRISDICARSHITPRRLMLRPDEILEFPKAPFPQKPPPLLGTLIGPRPKGKAAEAAAQPAVPSAGYKEPLVGDAFDELEVSPQSNLPPVAPLTEVAPQGAVIAVPIEGGAALDPAWAAVEPAAVQASAPVQGPAPAAVELDPKAAEIRRRYDFIMFEVDEYE